MKQTAVEWLVEQLKTMDTKSFNRLIQIEMSRENFEECFEQAKAMEKEQSECICVNVISRILDESEQGKEINSKEIFEKCYKEIFKSE